MKKITPPIITINTISPITIPAIPPDEIHDPSLQF